MKNVYFPFLPFQEMITVKPFQSLSHLLLEHCLILWRNQMMPTL